MSNVYGAVSTRLNAINNAQHILEQVEAHWAALVPFGAAPADKKSLVDAIAKAIVMNDALAARDDETIGELRPEIDDLLGSYRASAGLVAKGPRSVDSVAFKLLKPDGSFPVTEAALARYWKEMPQAIGKYATQLAARGFKRDDQARLVERMAAFMKLYNSKAKAKSATRKTAVARENVFHALAELTSYFRRLGRAALRGSTDRTAFDRVPAEAAARKKKSPPADGAQAAGATATAPMKSSLEPAAEPRN